ncbi:VOC family protein [Acidisoma cellulosilytica]|uniref:VOC family protein n=1 Tax=Acidisoma cellulosilyticum TaxID=2802395 RepID=A0A963Z261_9PROT|nr:VOC family protein [Acidisoma cellulosilyticum]MCB8880587.1 VOC family protein [Acidisoma cellulosilyticum]
MAQRIASITLLVDAYDKAIAYYVGALGFRLAVDTDRGGGDRWVEITPSGGGVAIRLAVAKNDKQRQAMGAQSGGRVLCVLYTDDLGRDVLAYKARGVIFQEEPRQEVYGAVAVFQDYLGNRWDLLQPAAT